MDIDAALAFARANHRGVLATTRRDGRPQLVPVVAGVDEAGQLLISTRAPSKKVANLRAQPFASCVLFTDAFFGPFVQIEGPVEIVPLPAAMEGLVALYRQVAGEHPDWEEFRIAMAAEERVLLRISPARVGPAAG